MAMDLTGVLQGELDKSQKVVANVSKDQLDAPTNCPGFDVRGLINHMAGANEMFGTVVSGGTYEPTTDADNLGDDHVAGHAAASKAAMDGFTSEGAMERACSFPFGDMPGAQAVGAAILETVAHRRDLAKATGQDPNIDEGTAQLLLAGAQEAGLDNFRGDEGAAFGHPQPCSDDAAAVDKLMAYLGRNI